MSKNGKCELLLSKAKEQEKERNWPAAAEFYEKTLRLATKLEDFSKAGEIQERIGHCLYRGAFQAETQQEFKSCMLEVVETYENAAALFEKIESLDKLAKISHCRAMGAYVNSWLAPDSSAKRQRLDKCWRLEKKALRVYVKATDRTNLGKTCNNLMIFLVNLLDIEWDGESREKMIEEALGYGEEAIKIFSETEDRHQLAQAYNLTAFFYRNAAFSRGFRVERKQECQKKALSYPKKAVEISEELGDAYLIGLSNFRLARANLDILGSAGLQERQHFEKALQYGILTKDRLLIADAQWGLEYATYWRANTEEDPEKAREEYRKLDEYREDATGNYNIIGHDAGIANSYCFGIAPIGPRSEMETNLKSKRLLIEEAVKVGYKGLEHARFSGSMGATSPMTYALGRALVCLARVETDTDRKRDLLEESSKYIEESINILKQAAACAYVEPREVNLSHYIWALALNQAELANTEETIEEKNKMLKSAITNMRSAREYWLKRMYVEKPQWFIFGMWMMTMGETLSQLYELTDDVNLLGKAVEAFKESVESYGKADSPFSRVAENYWQLAKAHNKMGDCTESARNFELASENYILAAKKIPQLQDFYNDHASYMEAWSEIEKARHHHAERHYEQAKDHYEKAANLHKSTERWSYLSHNYLAWARLEEAEDLSRREQTEEAKGLFQQAAKIFSEAKESIKARSERIEIKDEKEMADELVKASGTRREYCLGRIALEEAKILDRQGDHVASSKKYGATAEKFQKIAKAGSEQARKELQPIIYLCQAWQKMMMAEAKASSTMYGEAAELFKQAKEHTIDQPTSLLALANSSFCKALQAGTEFEITRDTTLYSAATKHLEAAAGYYLKAGFKTASEYAKATQRLLDAYVYMDSAKKETDPEKKVRYYMMTEKLLQASAGSYMKAKHLEKSEEVHRLLESVKEERQLAMSLSEVLHAPTVASTTTSFSTPTPTHEQPVGLERFEHANVQANLRLIVKEAMIGEQVRLRMELVNAGKAPAFLMKVDEIIPEGFEIEEVPQTYTVEDRYLDMKGKRLNPLKTEDVEIVTKPRSKGTFIINPRVLYRDETGTYMSQEPEPVTITVKELGIVGWIKGEK